MVALGYGKYFRSDSIVGMEPIEEGRGPGRRTYVYVQNVREPLIASRSEGAILGDMVEVPTEISRSREQRQLLADILDSLSDVNPMLRAIIRDQAGWDLRRLEERITELLTRDDV
jgi:hypothetical protein